MLTPPVSSTDKRIWHVLCYSLIPDCLSYHKVKDKDEEEKQGQD